MLLFLCVLILLFQYFVNVNNLNVGKMVNVSLNVPIWSVRLINAPRLNGTCEECLCAIITNSSTFTSIGSFNCFINNNTCRFFSKDPFYEYWLNSDINTTFYFLQEPTSM